MVFLFLILQNLLEHMPPEHRDYDQLLIAQTHVSHMQEMIHENMQKVHRVLKENDNSKAENQALLMSVQRRILHHAEVK